MIIVLWLVSQGISKRLEFPGVGSAVVIGFDYPGLACILRISRGCWSALAVGFDYQGLAGIKGDL